MFPDEQTTVWYWNGEDPEEELKRRVAAIAIHYQIPPAEIEASFFLDTGRKRKIVIAEQTRVGFVIARPVVDQVIKTIIEEKIGLFIVDPFVASHRVTENDTAGMEAVSATWAEIADVTGCAIELVHHTRKTGGADVTAEDARGSGTVLAKARSVRVLNVMSSDEAEKAGVENRKFYVRVETDKVSMTAPSDSYDWYRTIGVELGNGDNVGVVTTWQWPNAFEGVTAADLNKVQDKIAAGQWAKNVQAADWAGIAVAEALDMDIDDKADKSRIKDMIETWIKNKALKVESLHDARQGRKRPMIIVGKR